MNTGPWKLIGPFEAVAAFRLGEIPFEDAVSGRSRFADEMMAVLKSWTWPPDVVRV